ncbi:hypothetical protein BKA93DRAFT_561463 [Sparassis latifolia]
MELVESIDMHRIVFNIRNLHANARIQLSGTRNFCACACADDPFSSVKPISPGYLGGPRSRAREQLGALICFSWQLFPSSPAAAHPTRELVALRLGSYFPPNQFCSLLRYRLPTLPSERELNLFMCPLWQWLLRVCSVHEYYTAHSLWNFGIHRPVIRKSGETTSAYS